MPEERKRSFASAIVKRVVAAVFCGCFAWMAITMLYDRGDLYHPSNLLVASSLAACGAILCFLVAIGWVH
jgi:hypothetical protein